MDKLTPEQIVMLVQIVGFVIILVALIWLHSRQNMNLLLAITAAVKDIQTNPVALENARAAGAGIPQEAYDGLYGLTAAALALLGKDTPAGQAIAEIIKLAQKVDHNPENDPKTDATPLAGRAAG